MEHRRLQETGSTNDDAHAAFMAGAPRPLLISAGLQTAGKGRQGRPWDHSRENFAGSFLVDARRQAREVPGAAALLSSLALRDTLIGHGADPGAIALKWPNDVLIDDKKVAGILISFVHHANDSALIIGIGVNLTAAPQETVFPARAVFAEGQGPDPESFGDVLGQRLVGLMDRLERNGSWGILEAWRAHAWRIGQEITIRRDGTDGVTGRFEDINGQGHMLLRREDGTLDTIVAGDAAPR
ncbi:MAG: biotin--[acetyl-CoA-carboxylase] ligase [Pseudomonadota bacterium]